MLFVTVYERFDTLSIVRDFHSISKDFYSLNPPHFEKQITIMSGLLENVKVSVDLFCLVCVCVCEWSSSVA